MKKILAQLDKEIAKNSKLFQSACNRMNHGKSYKEMTEADFIASSKASDDYQKYDAILSALYPMKSKIEGLINNYSL